MEEFDWRDKKKQLWAIDLQKTSLKVTHFLTHVWRAENA